MRILIASPYVPWPINTGGNAAVFSTLKCLENDHQFVLVCPVYNQSDRARAKELQAQLPLVTVRAVDCGEPQSSLLRRTARWLVYRARRIFPPSASASASSKPLRQTPSYPIYPLPENFILALQEELSKGIDLCQAEFVEMMSLGAWLPKHIPTLFIHHQIHFIYSKRCLEVQGHDSYLDYRDRAWHVNEIALLREFDGIVTFSEQDRTVLLPWLKPEKIFTSPFPIPADVGIATELPDKFNGRFLFLASEENGPNRDALEWLLAEIWPHILRQLPSSQLVVIGKWRDATIARYSAQATIFTGFVEDLPAALKGGILLSPLRIGSGIRVKILAAMAQGVPVVSTSVGSEGLLVSDGTDLLVRDKPSEFVAAAVLLATDPVLWMQLAESGRAATFRNYSPEGVRLRRNEVYNAVLENKTNEFVKSGHFSPTTI